MHFVTLIVWEIRLLSSDLILLLLYLKISFHSLPLPSLIFTYLQALIHGFLWWKVYSWLIFSLKWHLQSPFLLLHSATINLQEAKDSNNEEDPRPTSSTWRYISCYLQDLNLKPNLNWCLLWTKMSDSILVSGDLRYLRGRLATKLGKRRWTLAPNTWIQKSRRLSFQS